MDDLPLMPAMKIIDYLSIEDVLNMKLVNKWFYQIINANVRINHLVLSTLDDLPYNRRLFYTCHLINLQNLLEYDLGDNVYFNLNQPILSRLKQLCIYSTLISLETLNSLDGLVHLEIIECEIKSIPDNDGLSLPMLEILNLNELKYDDYLSYYHNYNLLIDSTKLQALKFKDVDVSLVHPASITHLEVNYYVDCANFLPSCINLQHFYCHDLDLIDLNKFDLVKNLSKLKSIHLGESRAGAFDRLIKEKRRFNKDLKIYFINLEFEELPNELPIGYPMD